MSEIQILRHGELMAARTLWEMNDEGEVLCFLDGYNTWVNIERIVA
jgi:hypothetical protein